MRAHPEDPLHVLLTSDVVGGVWDFSCALASALTVRGHRVTLLAFGQPSEQHASQAGEAGAELRSMPLKLEWMRGSAEDLREARTRTARLVAELGPDVLHAAQFALGSVETTVPILLTAHSDVLTWRRWVEGTSSPEDGWQAYAAVVRSGVRDADEVTAVSRFLQAEMCELYRLQRQVRVISNGWAAPSEAAVGPVATRGQLSVLAGRAWDRAKNVWLAGEAARGRDLGRVVLAGESKHPETGTAPPLPETIEALGYLPGRRMQDLLLRARAFVSPALYDPFGLLPLQAALAGCPLLLANIPSYRELWDGAALFFDPHDPAHLRAQWQLLLGDQVLAARLADTARERARRSYSLDRMATRYLALYHQLTGRRADRSGETGLVLEPVAA